MESRRFARKRHALFRVVSGQAPQIADDEFGIGRQLSDPNRREPLEKLLLDQASKSCVVGRASIPLNGEISKRLKVDRPRPWIT